MKTKTKNDGERKLSTVSEMGLGAGRRSNVFLAPALISHAADGRRKKQKRRQEEEEEDDEEQCCQMAKFDPFLSLDCAVVECVGAQSKERKGSNFAAQHSRAMP